MPILTTNYSLNKPLVGDAIDEDLWGGYLNDNFDTLDTTVKSVSNSTYSNVSAKTANYTVVTGDRNDTVSVDATSGAITIALTAAATLGDGFEITIKKTDSSANAVTIDPNASETIDGATTYTLSNQNDFVTIVCNGTNWLVKSKVTTVPTAIFSSEYTSSQTSYSAGATVTFAHGLGAVPKLYFVKVVCLTAQGSLSIGDEFILSGYGGFNGAANATHGNVRANSTNVIVDVSVNGLYYGSTALTPANFALVAKAFK